MRKRLLVLACLSTAAPAAAQTAETPNLILTISGGLTAGGNLWSVDRQAYPVVPTGQDTFALGRRLRPGIVAALGASYYRGGSFGYSFEVGFFGLATESRCRPAAPLTSDPDNVNGQVCTSAQGAHRSTSIVAFQAGVTYRIAPRGGVTPYVRATGGFGILGNSFVDTEGSYTSGSCGPDCRLSLLAEGGRRSMAVVGTLAGGLVVTMSPGYNARLEGRDFIAALPSVTGPAPLTGPTPGNAQVATRFHHTFVLTAGIDIVLERRRARRY